MSFYTKENGGSNAEKMVLTQDGKLGIGTGSPSNLLHVQSTSAPIAKFKSSWGGALLKLIIMLEQALIGPGGGNFDGGSTSDFVIGNWSNGAIRLWTNAIPQRMIITNTGDVGIGTTNPGANYTFREGVFTFIIIFHME